MINLTSSTKFKCIISVLLCCLFFIGSTINAGAEVTQESIKQKESQIEAARQERENMKSSVTALQELKKSLQASKNDLDAYVKKLDSSLSDIQTKIDELEKSISTKEAEIEKTQQELEEVQEQQKEQYQAMKDRIRFMYERGDIFLAELFIKTGSFSEMLNKAEYVEQLSAYDRGKLQEYANTAKMVELSKEALEEEKETLNTAKSEVSIEKANMQELISDKNSEIYGISSDIKDKQAAIDEYEKSIADEDATIAALEKAVSEDRAKLTEQQKARTYDGGMFAWPCPAYTRISDDFGNRMHPILNIEKFHSGIDLAAPSGSAILAAYDGTVVAASYSGSMGNYVIIDHGGGLYTVYMHASSLSVSEGQDVTKGQTIAAVGSTGRSTGNHLHFGVRLNGQYVSPWNYLSQ